MDSSANKDLVRRRRITCVAVVAGVIVFYILARHCSWHGTNEGHALTELATTLVAALVGFLALVRFYSKKLNTVLFLGAGFLGATLLDGYHALVSASVFKEFFPSPPPSLIPWSGFSSRLFLAVLLWLSWAFWKREQRLGPAGTVKERQVYLIVAAWVAACFSFFALVPLPLAYGHVPLFHRPQELIPALFFLFAAAGYWRKQEWKRDVFEFWLLLAILLCVAQSLFMSTSESLYDAMYVASHLLKIFGYLGTLIGLLCAVYYLFVMEETVLAERTVKLRSEINERKRAEEDGRELLRREQVALQKIREERSFADAILESAPMICVIFNDRGRPLRWNRRFEQVLGYSTNRIPQLNILDTVAEPYRSAMQAKLQEASSKGSSLSEACLITKNNPSVPYLLTAVRVVLEGQSCFAGVALDISETKKTEERLQLQAAALNSAANAIVVTNAQGVIQWVNPAFTRLTGYELEEAVGQNPRILKSGKHDQAFYQNLWTTVLAGKTWHSEVTNRKKSGELYVEEMTIAPVRSAAGEIIHFVAIKQDVTERKRAQVELTQAKELAEAANRAKSEFLANMSHELRTPLNGMMGMTELALQTELTAEQREYLTLSKCSAETLLALINEILDFSKIEAGKMDFEAVDFNLRGSLETCLKSLSQRAHEKGLELNGEIAPRVPEMLNGDPCRLRQIVVNLVGNAIKFTEEGEVTLAVDVERSQTDSVVLHFQVRDTGIGIPENRREAIFDAFAQADGSTTRRYGGSGLGLTISRRLVEMFRGRIWLESNVGRGSTFHFTVQLRCAIASAFRPSLRAAELQDVPVLIVDDNHTNRRILEVMLAEWKMKLTSVDGAGSALRQIWHAAESGNPYRLILIDARMPEVDGFTLIESLNQSHKLAAPAIIMLTSGGQCGDAARCRQLGVAGYLTKPVGRSELLEAILQVLGHRPQEPEQRQPLVTRHSIPEHCRQLRILLAEDNLINRRVAVRLLEKHGYTVEVTENGREAVDKMQLGHFDVVLMDVQMPEMDGFEATAAIRNVEKQSGNHVPIIAMTAHALVGDRERCLAAGMDGYISKPFKIEELLALMEKVPQLTMRTD
jgi:two-component system, sensor histidine kinase and response regulator